MRSTTSFYSDASSLSGMGGYMGKGEDLDPEIQKLDDKISAETKKWDNVERLLGEVRDKLTFLQNSQTALRVEIAKELEKLSGESREAIDNLQRGIGDQLANLSLTIDGDSASQQTSVDSEVSFNKTNGQNTSRQQGAGRSTEKSPDWGDHVTSTESKTAWNKSHARFYKEGEWSEVVGRSEFKHHLLRNLPTVLSVGKNRSLEEALCIAVADGIPLVGPDAPETQPQTSGSNKGGWDYSSSNSKERSRLGYTLGVKEWKQGCSAGELPKYLRHIAEINSPGRMHNENLTHLQGATITTALLMSLKETSEAHPALQLLEDRGLLSHLADPLIWNAIVGHLYARYANEDQVTAMVLLFQQCEQKTEETLEKYFRRALQLGESCKSQMTLQATATKILGGMRNSPAKTEIAGQSMTQSYTGSKKLQSFQDLTGLVIEIWLPLATNHYTTSGITFATAPKDWLVKDTTTNKGVFQPGTKTGGSTNIASKPMGEKKRVEQREYCKKCTIWHAPSQTCEEGKASKEAYLKSKGGSSTPQQKSANTTQGGGGGVGGGTSA